MPSQRRSATLRQSAVCPIGPFLAFTLTALFALLLALSMASAASSDSADGNKSSSGQATVAFQNDKDKTSDTVPPASAQPPQPTAISPQNEEVAAPTSVQIQSELERLQHEIDDLRTALPKSNPLAPTGIPTPSLLAPSATAFGAIVALGIGIATLYRLHRQAQVNVLLDLTKRYAEVFANLPVEVKNCDLNYHGDGMDPIALKDAIRNFFYLYWIEHTARRTLPRIIPNKTWSVWMRSLCRYLEVPVVRGHWDQMRTEFDRGFQSEVDTALRTHLRLNHHSPATSQKPPDAAPTFYEAPPLVDQANLGRPETPEVTTSPVQPPEPPTMNSP